MICNLWDNTPSVLFFVFSRHSSPIALYPCPGKDRGTVDNGDERDDKLLVVTLCRHFTLLLCCKMLIYSYKTRMMQNVLTAVKILCFQGRSIPISAF